MRRSFAVTALCMSTIVSAAGLFGCEDGPNQPYSPAPAGAGGIWNGPPAQGGINADGGVYAPPATEGFDASFGGTNANDLCTATQEKAVWNKYFSEPIQIPGLAGGIDMAGGPNGDGASGYLGTGMPFTYDPAKETWTGATVEQAEKILCQGTADSIYYGVTNTLGWGENLELSVEYNVNSRQITDLLFTYGYAGTIDATSVDGKTKYSVSLNNLPIQITVSGATSNLIIEWSNQAALNMAVNGLYDALRNTYAPTFPADQDCVAAGHCVIGNNYSSGGYFFLTPLNLAIFVNNTLAPQPAASTIGLVDLGLLKLLPFSSAAITLKLDSAGEGPTADVPNVGGTGKNCHYILNQKFSDFDSTCVEPFAAAMADQNTINKNKLFGAMAHGDENYEFDIVGVDPQFAGSSIASNKVIGDTDRPGPDDISYEFTVDQYAIGRIANDYTNNDTTMAKDWHGNGMITLEWANLVQTYMQKVYGVTSNLGDTECIATPAKPTTVGKKCSGIEGIVTAAAAALAPATMAYNAFGAGATLVDSVDGTTPGTLAIGMKPGTWYSLFCQGAGATAPGYGPCYGGNWGNGAGGQAYFFDSMQSRVAIAFGGNPPAELASRRFYFKEWILAVIKYLQSAATPTATLAQIDANPVDPNEIFFDSDGGGFETGVYVFRQTVNSAMQAPTALEITTNLTTSVINDFEFRRYNFRGEKALYTALNAVATDQPGAQPLLLSNVVGSSVLKSTYPGGYACAINTDPTNTKCALQAGLPAPTAPLDSLGVPLFTGYQPAFGASPLNIAANGAPPTAAPVTVGSSDFTLIQSAMITLPIWSNPFDPTTATPTDKTVSVLVPYLPIGANVGFPVTIDGSRDKMYNTYNFDLTGSTVNGNIDFEYGPAVDPTNGSPVASGVIVRAVETQNYLGLVFVCAEPSTNPAQAAIGGKDILAVRMYQNAQDIFNWLSAHPNAQTDCNIQIKYSIYGNYPDFVSSLTNGVRFGLNPGFGGSVVSDVTVFDPNVVASLGQ